MRRHAAAAPPLLAMLVALAGPAFHAAASDCTRTSVGLVPLVDLTAGSYLGEPGGLWPGATNARPAAHDAALARVGRVQLLDAAGVPDAAGGSIVLISIGMSNTTQEFSTFKPLADADPEKNPRLAIVDCAQGGQTAAVISDPAANFWTVCDRDRIAPAGVTPAQVQAAWLKEANAGPTSGWPGYAQTLRDDLRAIAQVLKARYPNLRVVYLSSRIYAGYADTALNPEPYAYESAFSVRWLLEEQLAGDPRLEFDPARGPVLAPWLAWGPYLWADGLAPRSDGLTWECADFASDGTHPAAGGRRKVADQLLAFFKSDPSATPWFLDCDPVSPGTFAAPPPVRTLRVVKGQRGDVLLHWESLDPVVGADAVVDVASGSLAALRQAGSHAAAAACAATDLPDTPGSAGAAPAPGDAVWFLVRGRNSCGRGAWGGDLDPIAFACP